MLRWFIQVRWVVIALFALIGTIAWAAGVVSGASYARGLGLGAFAIAYNLGSRLLLRREETPLALAWACWGQMLCDVVAGTLLLHLFRTGGISPLTILYGVTVLAAAMILSPRGIYVLAGFAFLCYGALLAYEFDVRLLGPGDDFLQYVRAHESLAPTNALLVMLVALGITAYIAGQLATRLRTNEALIQQQVSDLLVQQRLAGDLAGAFDVDAVLQNVADTTRRLLGADAVSVALFLPGGEMGFRVASGLEQDQITALPHVPMPFDNPVLAGLRAGQPILAPQVDAMPGLRSVLVRAQTVSFYSFPLRVEQETIGAINFSFDRRYVMPASTAAMLDALSNQAALALARVQLYQEVARAALEMSSLYRIGLATSSSLEIDEVLMQIYRQVQEVLAPDAFFIALLDPDTGDIRFELVAERGQLLPLKGVPPGSESLTAWVARNRRALLIGHSDTEQADIPTRIVTGLNTQSVLILPLIAKDKVIGTISVQKVEPYAFDEETMRLMAAIAAQAALALENARLHAEMQARALRDSLTGAYNHATLIDRLDAALAAAAPQGQSLALIMLDVDRFKEFNDQLGHQAGDAALQALVQAIQANIKAGDTVGRWGGEEFGVVLPGATPAQAAGVAERIRDHLAGLTLVGPGGEDWPSPTVSQGVALFPQDAGHAAALVDVADRALYQAKARGRNQIVLAGRVGARHAPPDPIPQVVGDAITPTK